MSQAHVEVGEARIVHRHRGLVGRTVLVSGLILFSRILGFVREMLSAALFGDGSAVWDAFLTAWRVPNLFRRLLGEGALSTSLQTAITEADGDGGDEAGRRLFLNTVRLMSGILVAITVLGMLLVAAVPDVMPLTGWRWLGADAGPVRDLTVRLLPFVLLICLAALLGGALQVRGHFLVPNLAPAVLNTIWIAALVVLWIECGGAAGLEAAGSEGIEREWELARLLAWWVLFGGLVQILVHVPALLRRGLILPGPGAAAIPADGPRESAWPVLRAAVPLALGAAVYQVNVMIDGLMAQGLLTTGGPTALYYANRIQQFPFALIAIATTSSIFPSLKALGHLGRGAELRSLHDRSQSGILFLALPSAVGLFVLAGPISSVLFEHGNYGPEGVARMAATLRMLAIALIPAGAVALVARVYYAMNDFRTPVRISIAMLVANVPLNAFFVVVCGMDADGLALATVLTSWGNLLLLLPGLRSRLGLPAGGVPLARLSRMLLAAALSGACAYAAHLVVAALVGRSGPAADRSAMALLAAGLVGIASYVLAAALLRLPEVGETRARLARRFAR